MGRKKRRERREGGRQEYKLMGCREKTNCLQVIGALKSERSVACVQSLGIIFFNYVTANEHHGLGQSKDTFL